MCNVSFGVLTSSCGTSRFRPYVDFRPGSSQSLNFYFSFRSLAQLLVSLTAYTVRVYSSHKNTILRSSMIIVTLVSPRVSEILQISYVRTVQYKKTFLRVFHSAEISHENLIRSSNTLFWVSKTPDSVRCRFFYFLFGKICFCQPTAKCLSR